MKNLLSKQKEGLFFFLKNNAFFIRKFYETSKVLEVSKRFFWSKRFHLLQKSGAPLRTSIRSL